MSSALTQERDDEDDLQQLLVDEELLEEIHRRAAQKGFWDCSACGGDGMYSVGQQCQMCSGTGTHRNTGEAIMLIVTELAEAVEAMRSGNPASSKIDGVSSFEEEMADVLIRLFDLVAGAGYAEGFVEAVTRKLDYNQKRQYRHGKDF